MGKTTHLLQLFIGQAAEQRVGPEQRFNVRALKCRWWVVFHNWRTG
jgi:hypothetical protein